MNYPAVIWCYFNADEVEKVGAAHLPVEVFSVLEPLPIPGELVVPYVPRDAARRLLVKMCDAADFMPDDVAEFIHGE